MTSLGLTRDELQHLSVKNSHVAMETSSATLVTINPLPLQLSKQQTRGTQQTLIPCCSFSPNKLCLGESLHDIVKIGWRHEIIICWFHAGQLDIAQCPLRTVNHPHSRSPQACITFCCLCIRTSSACAHSYCAGMAAVQRKVSHLCVFMSAFKRFKTTVSRVRINRSFTLMEKSVSDC